MNAHLDNFEKMYFGVDTNRCVALITGVYCVVLCYQARHYYSLGEQGFIMLSLERQKLNKIKIIGTCL